MKTDVLVIDDEPEWLDTLSVLFGLKGWTVRTELSGQRGLKALAEQEFDLVLCDLAMPGMSGVELLKRLRADDNMVPFIIMTGVGTIQSAVEAMRFGAYNYVTKPFDADELEGVAQRAVEHGRLNRWLKAAVRREEKSAKAFSPVMGAGGAMEDVLATVGKVADSPAPVLIQGETGTGKSLLARHIHVLSDRREQPFLTIDCGALPENLLESELFGHVRGAFTGAVNARRGLVQAGQGGTVFLDEIGELPPGMQVKLLRVLQEREIRPVGSDKFIPVNVRFVSATHRELPAEVERGAFREDLYYRLAVVTVRLPPLRERREDIMMFAGQFVRTCNERYGKHIAAISPAALQILVEQPWKGNIRELENVLERAVLLTEGEVITPGSLGLRLPDPGPSAACGEEEGLSLQDAVRNAERRAIVRTLALVGGNKTKTAALLGISRRTLYDKLEEYRL